MKIILNDDQVGQICDKYQSRMSLSELGKIFNVSPPVIRRHLQSNNIRIRPSSEQKRVFKISENYFSNINTEIKAYTLGILYADGCNYIKKNKIILTQAENNKELIEILSNIWGTNISVSEPRKKNWQKMYTITISNKQISKDSERHGIVSNKTFKAEFPKQLPENLYSHFIRGYLDGDGCIYIHKKTSRISFIGTDSLMCEFQKIFKNILNVDTQILTKHSKNNNIIKELYTRGNHQNIKLLDWIYKDSNIYLERKYKKYITIKEIYRILHLPKIRSCFKQNCKNKHYGLGFCWNHWYEYKKSIK